MANRVREMLGCRYPVIQGAMGVICDPGLVAAISDAGGFGVVSTFSDDTNETVRENVKAVRKLTDKPFGAHLFAKNGQTFRFAEVLIKENIRAITVSGEPDEELIAFLHKHGVRVIPVVSTAKRAATSEALGADAVVVEGSESSGLHVSDVESTMVLIPMVANTVKIPVIAAGGIGEPRGYKAAMSLGAEGVQMRTRFIASNECIAHANYKKAILGYPEMGTVLLKIGGSQLRVLRTPLAEEKLKKNGILNGNSCTREAMEDAWIRGDLSANVLSAGSVAGLIGSVRPVKEIIEEMAGGMN